MYVCDLSELCVEPRSPPVECHVALTAIAVKVAYHVMSHCKRQNRRSDPTLKTANCRPQTKNPKP